MSWHSTENVAEFLDAAGDFLRSRPVENTLLLTIASAIQIRGVHAYGPDAPIFGWSSDGDGAFLQTPPHPLLLSAMPAGRAPELAELLANRRPLPGVNGLTADAEAFAANLESSRHQGGLIPHSHGSIRFDEVATAWLASSE